MEGRGAGSVVVDREDGARCTVRVKGERRTRRHFVWKLIGRCEQLLVIDATQAAICVRLLVEVCARAERPVTPRELRV